MVQIYFYFFLKTLNKYSWLKVHRDINYDLFNFPAPAQCVDCTGRAPGLPLHLLHHAFVHLMVSPSLFLPLVLQSLRVAHSGALTDSGSGVSGEERALEAKPNAAAPMFMYSGRNPLFTKLRSAQNNYGALQLLQRSKANILQSHLYYCFY